MTTIDIAYSPQTYWPQCLTPEQRLSRINGKERQQIAREIYARFGFAAINDFFVKETLDQHERRAWGSRGPWCLGGEFLPALLENEVEIARVSMASVTSDQVSVRATPVAEGIRYRMVGEYEDVEGSGYALPFELSLHPLSLGQLMDLIEGATALDNVAGGGLLSAIWLMMLESGYDEATATDFLSLDSAFYQQIQPCYLRLAEAWFDGRTCKDVALQ
jgi:hypothetical protein